MGRLKVLLVVQVTSWVSLLGFSMDALVADVIVVEGCSTECQTDHCALYLNSGPCWSKRSQRRAWFPWIPSKDNAPLLSTKAVTYTGFNGIYFFWQNDVGCQGHQGIDGERGKPGAPGLPVSTCTLDLNHVISNFFRFIANGHGVVTGKPWSRRHYRTQRIQRHSSKDT